MMNWYKIAQTKTILTKEDLIAIEKIVAKMMKGDRDWSLEELQLQQNFAEIIEEMLKKNMEN